MDGYHTELHNGAEGHGRRGMLGWELFWSDTSLVDECDDTDHVS